jgi:hypothetical protein
MISATTMGDIRMKKAVCLMFAFAALMFGTASTNAQTPGDASAAAPASVSQLSTADANFVAQANLGAPFQYEIQNGADPDLIEFARQTLPKIEDHLHRALDLAKGTPRETAGRG